MPLAVLYGHIYKGKATLAAVDQVAVEEVASLKKWQRLGAVDQVVVTDQARITRMIGEGAIDQIVVLDQASLKQLAKVQAVDSIGASPSEYDIAQATWLMLFAYVNYPGTMAELVGKIKNETGLIPGAL
jgi:hypothetical protein